MPHQRGFTLVGGVEPLYRGHQDTDIASRGAQRQAPELQGDQGKNLGIRRRGISAVKNLESHLNILIGPVGVMLLTPKDLARISITRRLRPMRHMHLHHRNREIRSQHLLAIQGVAGDIGTGPNVFPVKIKQRFGGLQERRFDSQSTCALKQRAQARRRCG